MTIMTLPIAIEILRPYLSARVGTKGKEQMAPREYMAERRPRMAERGLLKTGLKFSNSVLIRSSPGVRTCKPGGDSLQTVHH